MALTDIFHCEYFSLLAVSNLNQRRGEIIYDDRTFMKRRWNEKLVKSLNFLQSDEEQILQLFFTCARCPIVDRHPAKSQHISSWLGAGNEWEFIRELGKRLIFGTLLNQLHNSKHTYCF